jgi:hypothetical protein
VVHILEGLRHKDQVILVLPFFEHDDFKVSGHHPYILEILFTKHILYGTI